MKERVILHCDMNNCYASIEIKLNPSLKGKAVAVCGDENGRHAIILAKNDIAKKSGVLTAEPVYIAKQKCPDLTLVSPHFDQYIYHSNKAKEIYKKYTDLIEPMGIDECWLDVTASIKKFGSGYDIAFKIKEEIKKELGITISVGVSFNKVFAKLGSDMKKPDAITQIPFSSFKSMIWNLPASDMIGVGRSTSNKLSSYAINTIGDLAKSDLNFLQSTFGKSGQMLWLYANGLDNSKVSHCNNNEQIKSIGHSSTCAVDLKNNTEVSLVFLKLSQTVSLKLKQNNLVATAIQIAVKDSDKEVKQYQQKTPYPISGIRSITDTAYKIFCENYKWNKNIRALTVRVINLQSKDQPIQLSLFNKIEKIETAEKVDSTVCKIKNKFGNYSIGYASELTEKKLSHLTFTQPNF